MYLLSLIIGLGIYTVVHLYFAFLNNIPKMVLMPLLGLIFFIMNAYWINFILKRVFHKAMPEFIIEVSYFSVSVGFYILFLYIISDLLKIIPLYRLNLNLFYEGIVIILVSFCLFVYGYARTKVTKFTVQEYTTYKKNVDMKIVFFSDTHIGSLGINKERFVKAVEEINALNPDLILIGGDILDAEIKPFRSENYGEEFKKLKAKYGTYAILGNHEYYGDLKPEENLIEFEKYGMNVLRDESIYIKELNTEIIGQDMKVNRPWSKDIKSVKELKEDIENFDEKYSILLAHTPKFIEESGKEDIDLQLSGHTHNGQFFPVNYIVKFMYKNAFGYKKFDKMDSYVSCGFGLWGPPMRIASFQEVVVITIKSK